ncbi:MULTISPECIES: metalloregulator ArsR/SmtB family transcription factor [Streptacidiphilus]|uniref:ArsR/SmtB family transcription factor n=2 Tax=Streptacidiphilus TaxID=228398 RepID=A0ABV6UV02_9ACTN|nr:metalloregulator ArsR/SmtB family transcription factor [Streptacidiphilus jeojiense]
MGHGVDERARASARERLDHVGSAGVATMLQALATPSRLLILARLVEGPCSASDLATAAGMERSACSHQLRLLKNLGLVVAERHGRSMVYALYDNHVAELLDQAIYHVEHLKLGLPDAEDPATTE